MDKIKLPVGVFPYESGEGYVICDITDADGTIICTMVHNGTSSQTRHERANQIADALNTAADKPIDMLLYCPRCFKQHVDDENLDVCESCGHPESEHFGHKASDPDDVGCYSCGGITTNGCHIFTVWLNPPHKSHRCNFCNHVWRPADVPTNGVQKLETSGKNDGLAKPVAFANGQDFNDAVKTATAALEGDSQ